MEHKLSHHSALRAMILGQMGHNTGSIVGCRRCSRADEFSCVFIAAISGAHTHTPVLHIDDL